ncbi:major facilitator superfamily [Plasmopara halstedii]|uniref:Major facilitator superfamily n=1 Tax=Plasmopara halstedii TaxID=4781 RepID=A0A0P1B2G0_PLAHL|nr:major facilitator superfamily [Plasmopara halstedii]CEG48927.1 major facilitator superfamily [Plasmopara halstedii]|eukprot:XP_024585296.1 major facilitator superfamily [Plasmopara halstedii]
MSLASRPYGSCSALEFYLNSSAMSFNLYEMSKSLSMGLLCGYPLSKILSQSTVFGSECIRENFTAVELIGGEDMPTFQVSTYGLYTTNSFLTAHLEDDVPETAWLLSRPLLSIEHKPRTCIMYQVGKQGAIVLLCCINLLNYIDRGIIPGAPEKFNHFITNTLDVSVLRQSVYFGLLTSAFIASYSIFSIVFGYFALTHRPFRIIALGMTVWVVAVAICGVAQASQSYYVLIIGRLVSGVGEASFQCTATPFINRHAPPAKRSLYLGIYLASITVGTAVGYIYGSIFASSGCGWAGAYFVEGIIMIGFIVCCLTIVPDELNQIPAHIVERDEIEHKQSSVAIVPNTPDDEEKARTTVFWEDQDRSQPLEKPSFLEEWWAIFTCWPFMLIILGHAAYTFSLAAMSTFSPAIFIGLRLFEDETTVSLIFGGLVAITGTIGTPLGGILVDYLAKKKPDEIGRRCVISVKALFYFMVAAVAFGLVMVAFTSLKVICLIFLTLCLFCMCALTVPETIAILELFPESRRSMAVAANTLVIHALGDVPSPIILGAIKDAWAPDCGTVEIDGEAGLNPACAEDHVGLRNVLLFAVLWLVWGVIFWGVAVIVLKQKQEEEKRHAARRGLMVSAL